MSKKEPQNPRDPTQIAPPKVDSGMKWKGIKASDMMYAIPGAGVAVGGLGAAMLGAGSIGLGMMGAGATVAGASARMAHKSGKHSSGIDRVLTSAHSTLSQREMPLSPGQMQAVHGIERIYADGTIETTDGRLVAIARIDGRNTTMQSTDDSRKMVGRLRTALDEHVRDFSFSFYSTSVEYDPDKITDKYLEARFADHYSGRKWRTVRTLLSDIHHWYQDRIPKMGLREWKHYVVVQVRPDEVSLPDYSSDSGIRAMLFGDDEDQSDARRSRMKKKLEDRIQRIGSSFTRVEGVDGRRCSPAEVALLLSRYWAGTDHSFDESEVTETVNMSVWPDESELTQENREQPHRPEAVEQDDSATKRTAVAEVSDVEMAADGGATTEETTTETVASRTDGVNNPSDTHEDGVDATHASFFANVREGLLNPLGDDEETGAEEIAIQSNRIQKALSPARFDAHKGYLEVGNQYCKTFWIAGWPSEPTEQFLQRLYTKRNLDIDVHLRAQARDKKVVREVIKKEIGKMDADVDERKDENDIDAILVEEDMDPYVKMFKLLHQTKTQPWSMSGYVTLRVGKRQALDVAEERVEEGLADPSKMTLDIAMQRALDEAEDELRNVLEESPANLVVKDLQDTELRQKQLFESCSPAGTDRFEGATWKQRSQLMLSGAIAATFPPGSAYIDQDDGVEQGLNTQNSSIAVTNAFSPGPGHKLILGDSGSGKTYKILYDTLRWNLLENDRTVIYMDTMGGFKEAIDITDGNHIMVDGSQTINPLHIEETPEEVLRSDSKIDPWGMKFTEAKNYILGILGSDADDAQVARFAPLVKDALRNTYIEAGVKPNRPETHKPENSPTMVDFREMVEDMGDNPDKYVTTSLEKKEVRDNAGPLLRKLNGFTEGGEYDAFTGKSEAKIVPGETNYIDLEQIQGLGGAADMSTILQLLLGWVYQAVKRAPDETIFMIDEAHYLFDSKDMLAWLQQASRHWRHHKAGLWMASHRPGDFVEAEDKTMKEYKDAIRGQVNTTEIFPLSDLAPESAQSFDLNTKQAEFVRRKAVRGENEDYDYSESLMKFTEKEGWFKIRNRASPFEHLLLTYDSEEDGELEEYLESNWNGGWA